MSTINSVTNKPISAPNGFVAKVSSAVKNLASRIQKIFSDFFKWIASFFCKKQAAAPIKATEAKPEPKIANAARQIQPITALPARVSVQVESPPCSPVLPIEVETGKQVVLPEEAKVDISEFVAGIEQNAAKTEVAQDSPKAVDANAAKPKKKQRPKPAAKPVGPGAVAE